MAGQGSVSGRVDIATTAVLFACLALCVSSQAGEGEPSKKMEEEVFSDMLKIVDNKFDTLTVRITALERAISQLHYFSIRQLRHVSTALEGAEKDLKTVSKQVGQLEVDGRSMKILLNLMSRDVSDMKTTSSDTLKEIETNAPYINENTDKQVLQLKAAVEEIVTKATQDSANLLIKHVEEIAPMIDQMKMEPVNCSSVISAINQHLDTKLADLSTDTRSYVNEVVSAMSQTDDSIKCANDKQMKDEENKNEHAKNSNGDSKNENGNPNHPEIEFQNEMDEQVMTMLFNMTSSVQQATSYFRNTGRMLEQITSSMDILVGAQADLTRKFDLIQLTGHGRAHDSENEVSNVISETGADDKRSGCVLSKDISKHLEPIIKNNTHIFEVVMDLAHEITSSLASTTASLQDEIKRVEGIRTTMATEVISKSPTHPSDQLTTLTNLTERTFKLLESVAYNTGWIPNISRNVQHIEIQQNRSLLLAVRAFNLMQQTQQFLNPNKTKEIISRDSMQIIYSTSLQLIRIMPALTKMLAEPDPLITLVGGGRPDQGRIEIYHNGQWGALCLKNLTHTEANTICRHLGFTGGISAGAGFYGPGGGVAWVFNASCLDSAAACPVVTHTEETPACSHELDAAVVCDHMLRVIPGQDSKVSKAGRLEIHHRGLWIPVCGNGWNDMAARTACRQMGYADGKELELGEWRAGSNSTWLGRTFCKGEEKRLDACTIQSWVDPCPGLVPAGVKCL